MNRILSILFIHFFVLEAYVSSVKRLMLSVDRKFSHLNILFLETAFLMKYFVSMIVRKKINREKFWEYQVHFPNYLEFCLLFIEIFGLEEYKLSKSYTKPTIIDGGASWGMSVLYFKSLYPHAKIIAIEANAKTVEYLKKNIKVNKLNTIKVVNAILSAKKGRQDFYSFKMDGWSVSDTAASDFKLSGSDYLRKTMPSCRLSDLLRRHVDIIKLDIEGMEGEVIFESRQHLKSVSEIVLEHHPSLNVRKNSLENIKHLLSANGFIYQFRSTKQLLIRASRVQQIVHATRT